MSPPLRILYIDDDPAATRLAQKHLERSGFIVEIANDDQIFHAVYDLNDRFVIPGAEHLGEGSKKGGTDGHWFGIYDDKGRVMVVANYNQDTGDAWEWADSPRYPIKFSDLAIRLGVNYVTYAMTH